MQPAVMRAAADDPRLAHLQEVLDTEGPESIFAAWPSTFYVGTRFPSQGIVWVRLEAALPLRFLYSAPARGEVKPTQLFYVQRTKSSAVPGSASKAWRRKMRGLRSRTCRIRVHLRPKCLEETVRLGDVGRVMRPRLLDQASRCRGHEHPPGLAGALDL